MSGGTSTKIFRLRRLRSVRSVHKRMPSAMMMGRGDIFLVLAVRVCVVKS